NQSPPQFPTPHREKEGSCPIPVTRCAPPPPPPLCKSDSDCKGKQKCCTPLCHQECIDPVKGNVLPVLQGDCILFLPSSHNKTHQEKPSLHKDIFYLLVVSQ
uniref:WAP domain-containing protein n=1 Tax=Leptobrachium leishanense TaxID=445787 RepID=A0A8C5MT52_9ANUR